MNYWLKVAITLCAAGLAVPSIAGGFYMIYEFVTFVGN